MGDQALQPDHELDVGLGQVDAPAREAAIEVVAAGAVEGAREVELAAGLDRPAARVGAELALEDRRPLAVVVAGVVGGESAAFGARGPAPEGGGAPELGRGRRRPAAQGRRLQRGARMSADAAMSPYTADALIVSMLSQRSKVSWIAARLNNASWKHGIPPSQQGPVWLSHDGCVRSCNLSRLRDPAVLAPPSPAAPRRRSPARGEGPRGWPRRARAARRRLHLRPRRVRQRRRLRRVLLLLRRTLLAALGDRLSPGRAATSSTASTSSPPPIPTWTTVTLRLTDDEDLRLPVPLHDRRRLDAALRRARSRACATTCSRAGSSGSTTSGASPSGRTWKRSSLRSSPTAAGRTSRPATRFCHGVPARRDRLRSPPATSPIWAVTRPGCTATRRSR